MELLPNTLGRAHHELKLEVLDKTFAFPAIPSIILVGAKLLAPVAVAVLAALAHIALA
tara:strand:- start:226 stop:399 length:174 start_codon:yes stop_codon:yes gene_type:complete